MNTQSHSAVPRRRFFTRLRDYTSPVKKTYTYREKSQEKRREFLSLVAEIPPEKQIYVDESGINKAIQRDYGRALRGARVEDTKPGRAYQRLNVIGACCCGQTFAECRYTKNTTKDFFELWFEVCLGVRAPKGSTVILDNASFHSKTNLAKLAAALELKLLFLPPYSPDLNPIEKAWANMKRSLRDIIPRFGSLKRSVYHYFDYGIP